MYIQGGLFEKITFGTSTEYKHHIVGGDGRVAIHTRRSPGTSDTIYLLQDHLGSTDKITDSSGGIKVHLSYDAFGQRRGANWSGTPNGSDWTTIKANTHRGYTDHEQLDNLNLIHMNGRVYDPAIGRFQSADPYVPDPYNGQSFNRYSYVNNSPLSYTDPSGFDRESFDLRLCDGDCFFPATFVDPHDHLQNRDYSVVPNDGAGPSLWQQVNPFSEYNLRQHYEDIVRNCPDCDSSKPLSDNDRILIGYYKQLTMWSLGGAGGIGESVVVGASTRGATRAATQALPKLQRIHSVETLTTGSARYNYDAIRRMSTDDIVKSLRPGSSNPLTVKPDGRIFEGNTRILVLEERGYDISSLPRVVLGE